MNRSPIILRFDKDEPYRPDSEDVFDGDDEDGIAASLHSPLLLGDVCSQ